MTNNAETHSKGNTMAAQPLHEQLSMVCDICKKRMRPIEFALGLALGEELGICTTCYRAWKAEGGAATAWPEGLSVGGDTDGGTPDVYQG